MPSPANLPPETPIWSGSPSQWLNFGAFFLCAIVAGGIGFAAWYWHEPLIAAGIALPALVALWKALGVSSRKIEITTQRVKTRIGIFSRRSDDMELYRVKDTALEEPFLLRLVGRANILLRSSDRSTPSMVIPAVKNAEAVRQQIRASVETLRTVRGVREMDMDVET